MGFFHRARVQAARDLQNKLFSSNGSSDIVCNADMRVGEIRQFCKLQAEGVVLSLSKHQSLMRAVVMHMNLSARACHRILKLERRIADRAGSGGEPIRAFGGGVAVATQVDKLGCNLRTQNGGSILYIDKKKVSWENVTSYGNSYRTMIERIGTY